jgi:predicted enzyme related to lactoylglutathione lyase
MGMSEANPRGRFVWFDLMTSDPKAAPAFYSAVAGWGTQVWDGPMQYTMWTNGEKPLGGVTEVSEAGTPPHWLGYISTPSLENTLKEAESLGARVFVPPTDIPNVGRFAILADPQGAVFAIYTSDADAGPEGPATPGEFSWHELATHDSPAAFRFYEKLFGWEKTTTADMGELGMYYMYGRNGIELGGMFNKPATMPGPPAWLYYILVEDIQRAIDAVKANGGQVLIGPHEVPGGDLIAQCLDPQGAAFALHAKKKS